MALRVGTSLGAVAAALLLPSSVHGAPMQTCSEQGNCMQWTVTNVVNTAECPSQVGGACSEVFKVCVKILPRSVDRPNCPAINFGQYCKLGGECPVEPEDLGVVRAGGFPFEQCQYGPPLTDLYFVFKDGLGCGSDPEQQWPLSQCEGVPAMLSCYPRPASFQTCALDNECVWHVVTPPQCQKCQTTSSTSSTTSSTTSSATSSTTSSTTSSPTSSASSSTKGHGQESLPKNMKAASLDPFANVMRAAAGGDKSVDAGASLVSIILVSAGVLMVLSRRARTPPLAPLIQAEAVE